MNGRANLKSWLVMSIFLLGMGCATAEGRTIYVDDDGAAEFDNIQAAIDDSNDGDTIIVRDGTYTGDGNRDIDFLGKAITLRSENGPESCIIDCNGTADSPHRGFYFHSGEKKDSILNGFSICNGFAEHGGGIKTARSSSPTIVNCRLINNKASQYGGGLINIYPSNLVLKNCLFLRNFAEVSGGAIHNELGNVKCTQCTFFDNKALIGGAFLNFGSSYIHTLSNNDIQLETSNSGAGNSVLLNCVFSGNYAEIGGGMATGAECQPELINCILYNNSSNKGSAMYIEGSDVTVINSIIRHSDVIDANMIFMSMGDRPSSLSIQYSAVQGGQAAIYDPCDELVWGDGNIDVDPCFADANNGDYHLKSQAGRWDANEGRWTKDEVTSPSIDEGDPRSPIGLEPFPNGGIINMGAYGGTAEASKSYFGEPVCETIVAGDINGDCKVDFWDFQLMALHWLQDENQ